MSTDAATAIERVRAIHQPKLDDPAICGGCDELAPCTTTRALDQEEETP